MISVRQQLPSSLSVKQGVIDIASAFRMSQDANGTAYARAAAALARAVLPLEDTFVREFMLNLDNASTLLMLTNPSVRTSLILNERLHVQHWYIGGEENAQYLMLPQVSWKSSSLGLAFRKRASWHKTQSSCTNAGLEKSASICVY
jgi:hypothetical protein